MTGSEIATSARERLGPIRVWLTLPTSAPIDEERQAVRRIEELGYGSLWCGEGIGGKEAFAHQSLLLAATERILTGTRRANVWARHPATMEGGEGQPPWAPPTPAGSSWGSESATPLW
jgi:hypothetical protein